MEFFGLIDEVTGTWSLKVDLNGVFFVFFLFFVVVENFILRFSGQKEEKVGPKLGFSSFMKNWHWSFLVFCTKLL